MIVKLRSLNVLIVLALVLAAFPLFAQEVATTEEAGGLMAWFSWLWHTTFVMGGMISLVNVASIDYQAFRSWQSAKEAVDYDWGVALFRWGQGFIGGGLAATVFAGMLNAGPIVATTVIGWFS